MRKVCNPGLTLILFLFLILGLSRNIYAYTTTHHLVNMGRDVLNIIASPVKSIFINGPREVKKMYQYEVHEREKPEKRHLLKHKLFAFWSAPAVETKSIIDGIVDSARFSGKFFKEFLSIPFSD
jgi:hypothetical protein